MISNYLLGLLVTYELMKYCHEATVAHDNVMRDEALKGLSAKLIMDKMRGPFGTDFPDPPPPPCVVAGMGL